MSRIVIAKEPTEIHLLDSQTQHVGNIERILGRSKFALDLSMLGAGKTQTSSYQALQRPELPHVIVVCPVSVQGKWKHMAATHGLPLKSILSQQSLRSQKCKQPSHGLLQRRDYQIRQLRPGAAQWEVDAGFDVMTDIDKVEFKPTPSFLKMVDEGLLLIVDEIQNIKNVSNQFLACQALMKPILEQSLDKASRVLLLSGSPIDREHHAVHLFRSLNIHTEESLARTNLQTYTMEWTGLNQIVNFCTSLDAAATNAVQRPGARATSETGLIMQVQNLFQRVFKKHLSSFMLPPPIPVKIQKRNAFQKISGEPLQILKRGIALLKTSASWDAATGAISQGADASATMANITRALQVIETAKIQLFQTLACQSLDAHPQMKVVIAVNFVDTISDLKTLFEKDRWKVRLLTGSMSEPQRTLSIAEFQKASTDCRILIANQSVCSTGIDLDDKDGNFPRMCQVSPNQATITAQQLGHRFQRADTKSDATVHFTQAKETGRSYSDVSNEATVELRVLNSLARKAAIMKQTTSEQADHGVIFPCDHEIQDEVTDTDEGWIGRGSEMAVDDS